MKEVFSWKPSHFWAKQYIEKKNKHEAKGKQVINTLFFLSQMLIKQK